METEPQERERPEWREERLRYRVLRSVYEQSGADCTRSITATQLDCGRSIALADLFRIVDQLVEHGYVFRMGTGLLLCITPKGIRYVEKAAGRRHTVRLSHAS